jgi:hypothetical protein
MAMADEDFGGGSWDDSPNDDFTFNDFKAANPVVQLGTEGFQLWNKTKPRLGTEGHAENTAIRRVAFIRNSDRSVFKECRRKWDWSWVHRGNRTGTTRANPLWLGSAIHWALEDRHGYRRFPNGEEALRAYHLAWIKGNKRDSKVALPADHQELINLGIGMLRYYETWLGNRDPLNTYHVKGVPQVEVKFRITLPIPDDILQAFGWDEAVVTGTIDRVIIDELGRLWLLDYKTAARFETSHFDLDPQISLYTWAASILYPGMSIAGFVYQQHKKQVPDEPKFLSSTGAYSVAKNQVTTRPLYYKALKNMYGSITKAPQANLVYLDYLAAQEGDMQDRFIRRDFVERNRHQIISTQQHLVQEACDMLNPNLPIYPNPTRDCAWRCSTFHQACINKDDGADWVGEMELSTVDRSEEDNSWSKYLELPNQQAEAPWLAP